MPPKRASKRIRAQQAQSEDVFPFLRLPAELRIKVYDYSLDWNDGIWHFSRVQKALELRRISQGIKLLTDLELYKEGGAAYTVTMNINPKEFLHTPTILLLNRQISSEAKHVLHRKELVMDANSPKLSFRRKRCLDTYRITDCISATTFSFVRKMAWIFATKVTSRRNFEPWVEMLSDMEPLLDHGHLESVHLDFGPGKSFTVKYDLDLVR